MHKSIDKFRKRHSISYLGRNYKSCSRSAEARLGAARAELKLAQLDLGRTEISLPYDARVVSSSVSVGELVGPVEGVDSRASVVAPQTRLASLFLKFVHDRPLESLPLPGTFVEVEIQGPAYRDVYVLPDSVLQEGDSVWTVRDGVLRSLGLQALGHTAAGMVVEAFDAGEGVVTGIMKS